MNLVAVGSTVDDDAGCVRTRRDRADEDGVVDAGKRRVGSERDVDLVAGAGGITVMVSTWPLPAPASARLSRALSLGATMVTPVSDVRLIGVPSCVAVNAAAPSTTSPLMVSELRLLPGSQLLMVAVAVPTLARMMAAVLPGSASVPMVMPWLPVKVSVDRPLLMMAALLPLVRSVPMASGVALLLLIVSVGALSASTVPRADTPPPRRLSWLSVSSTRLVMATSALPL